MGSGSGPAMKTAMPLTPAISPNATKADTRPSLRNSFGAEPTYPNSGCRSRAKGTVNSSVPRSPHKYIAAKKNKEDARQRPNVTRSARCAESVTSRLHRYMRPCPPVLDQNTGADSWPLARSQNQNPRRQIWVWVGLGAIGAGGRLGAHRGR